jgi:diadenylate cyclase
MEILTYKFNWTNLVDFMLVLLIGWQLFVRVKGSLAFNIMIGLLTLYAFWWVVKYFEMPLLETILGGFANFGVVAVLIVFQQEIRRFLLIIGRNSFLGENKKWWNIFPWKWKLDDPDELDFETIVDACQVLAETHTGAIIIFPKTSEMRFLAASGETIDANVTKRLILTIFNKTSPLHDGAMIIVKGKIKAANCVLPVSDNPDLINKFGLRHLSAIGITEQTDAICLVISEERGYVSFVKEGKITEAIDRELLIGLLNLELKPKVKYE